MSNGKEVVYSWSRLNSFHSALNNDGCLYGWYKTYIEGDRGSNNFFGLYGSLFHELIEDMHKNKIMAWDVDDIIRKQMAEFEFQPPFEKMRKSYEDAIYRFFNDFDNIFSDYQVQQAEEEKVFKIGNTSMRGFPDLIGQHKTYGMIIGDFKSSKRYTGADLKHKAMQMYLYAIPFIQEYGYEPDHLVFMFVREKENRELAIKFDRNELEHTKDWVLQTVEKIEKFKGEWEPVCQTEDGNKSFYSNYLCNHRLTCPHKCSYNSVQKDAI